MNDNIIKIRIKVKHLMAEARINRHEASKLSGPSKHSLNHHRQWTIRNEARATQLVYALQRGVPYAVVEPKVTDKGKFDLYIVPRIRKMASKYPTPGMQSVDDWLAGKEHPDARLHSLRDEEPLPYNQECAEAPRCTAGDGFLQRTALHMRMVR